MSSRSSICVRVFAKGGTPLGGAEPANVDGVSQASQASQGGEGGDTHPRSPPRTRWEGWAAMSSSDEVVCA